MYVLVVHGEGQNKKMSLKPLVGKAKEGIESHGFETGEQHLFPWVRSIYIHTIVYIVGRSVCI